MAKKTKLPFSMMPASWGLKGKSRAIAEAEYYYDGEELEKALAAIDAETDEEKSVAEIEIDIKNGKLSQSEGEKKIAELKEEPWVNVNKMGINPENAKAGFIELDWNDHFVAMLHDNGYTGTNDEDVVNKWFNDVCRTVLLQERADLDYGLQEGQREDVIRSSNIDRDEDED
jgi:hypothetical protein|tara:strand:+ start:105 stop:620 length:516 start_codon:yes stop_codon:yes gene_type:complete